MAEVVDAPPYPDFRYEERQYIPSRIPTVEARSRTLTHCCHASSSFPLEKPLCESAEGGRDDPEAAGVGGQVAGDVGEGEGETVGKGTRRGTGAGESEGGGGREGEAGGRGSKGRGGAQEEGGGGSPSIEDGGGAAQGAKEEDDGEGWKTAGRAQTTIE